MSHPRFEEESGQDLARRLERRWMVLDLAANVVGVLVVLTFLHAVHSSQDRAHGSHEALIAGGPIIAYLALAMPLAWAWRRRRTAAIWEWLSSDRPAGPEMRDLVLRAPLREVVVPATLWGLAVVLFGSIKVLGGSSHAIELTLTLALAGLTTCTLICLLTERLLRPVMVRALASSSPGEPAGPGIATRLTATWVLASGIPLLGVGLLAIGVLAGHSEDVTALAVAFLVVVAAGLAAGSTATVLSCRSLADPIAAVRRGLAGVHAGNLDVEVAVDDGSEIGQLQAGFNEMAAGLRERERLRDLFGRHVGEDVARRALAEGVVLGGEVREVAALFIDLVGSTALAARHPPEEVVSLLNRFFAVVVDIVGAHGGWVNRFEGDGALCIFGAPTELTDPAASALATGRVLAERLGREIPEIEVGIGISGGPAVAGNVGAERRHDYTVIGDPINEAARLCELAKTQPERVIASGTLLARASAVEAGRWRLGDETVLRGRTEPTRLAAPMAGHRTGKLVPN